MSGYYRCRYASASSSNSSYPKRSSSVLSHTSNSSSTLSDISTLSHGTQSTWSTDSSFTTVASPNYDSVESTEVDLDLSNEVELHTESPVSTSGPWSNTEDFDVEIYLAGFAPQKRDTNGHIVAEPLIRCLQGTSDLIFPEKPVFQGVIPKTFIFEISWPRYPIWQNDLLENFASEFENGTQLTRHILAHLIAKEYQLFASYYGLKANERLHGAPPVQPEQGGMIGPGGIDFYRMNIAYIIQKEDGIWSADHGLMVSYPK